MLLTKKDEILEIYGQKELIFSTEKESLLNEKGDIGSIVFDSFCFYRIKDNSLETKQKASNYLEKWIDSQFSKE